MYQIHLRFNKFYFCFQIFFLKIAQRIFEKKEKVLKLTTIKRIIICKRHVNFSWRKINLMKRKNSFDRMDKKTKRTCTYKRNLIFVKFLERFRCYFFFAFQIKKIYLSFAKTLIQYLHSVGLFVSWTFMVDVVLGSF